MSNDHVRECVDRALLIVTPRQRSGVDWSGLTWEIIVHAHPEYAEDDFDTPIELSEKGGTREDLIISLYPENAEDLGWALIRAAEMRRKLVADRTAELLAKPLPPSPADGGSRE